MHARRSLTRIMGFGLIVLSMMFQQCAWLLGTKDADDLVKPTPIGGYDQLQTRVHYPRAIREEGIEGTVEVNALINKQGQVVNTRLAESLHPTLDQIVVNAIKRTEFYPATRNGEVTEVWIAIPFVFAFRDWPARITPFTEFSMTIHPDPAYQNFEVEMMGQIKAEIEKPLRFECLLPFNAVDPWAQSNGTPLSTSIVRDDQGEWLIFDAVDQEVVFGFNYKSLGENPRQKLFYELTLNQSLPSWTLRVVYGSQKVIFTQTPDRESTWPSGETQFEYDFAPQSAYEPRFLELELQK